jgi:DNA-binding Lrp family transcriptional regulator
MHYNAQKSFKEIAEFLRLPVATAFKCLRRYERNGKQVIDGRRFNG